MHMLQSGRAFERHVYLPDKCERTCRGSLPRDDFVAKRAVIGAPICWRWPLTYRLFFARPRDAAGDEIGLHSSIRDALEDMRIAFPDGKVADGARGRHLKFDGAGPGRCGWRIEAPTPWLSRDAGEHTLSVPRRSTSFPHMSHPARTLHSYRTKLTDSTEAG
jgi:hypothetical protein